ncbi:MAG: hypothetical protein JJE13_11015 [Thermoleophilia bacterium]|nr:hypothetical protein [Thermoleophilia bacterium]
MFDNVPNDAAGYVMAAYIFFLLMVLIYIGILGAKFQRISREIGQLTDEVEAGKVGVKPPAERPEPAREESSV